MSPTTIRQVLNLVIEKLNQGETRFVVDAEGRLNLEKYLVSVACVSCFSEAAELITRVPSLSLDFERTDFGDYFGIVCSFEERISAEEFADSLRIPPTAIRDNKAN